MAKKIVLAGACRTAIGVMGGALSTTPAPELGTIVIKEALKRSGVKPEQVDMVYMGCVIQAGTGQNPARQAAVNAGIPVESPAITINVLCGSGLDCVNTAARMIGESEADIIVAGGIALGHPVGCSGCRILVTLLYEMEKRDAKKGLATLCVGGGMGCAAIVERE